MGYTTSPGGYRDGWAGAIATFTGVLTAFGLVWAGPGFDVVTAAAVIGIMITTIARSNEIRVNSFFTEIILDFRCSNTHLNTLYYYGERAGGNQRLMDPL
jgi:hypothetical protein